jgi:hypothetical protein
MYEELKAELNAIQGIQFTEYEWATRPKGNHGVYQIDFHADSDIGDDGHVDQAVEGSVDIWTNGHCGMIAAAVESALETVCEGSWHLTLMEVDEATRMLRREYVFQMEAV